MTQEPLDVNGGQLGGVPLAKINDVAFNPIDISLLGADGIVLDPDAVTHLIEQAARLWAGCRFTKQWRDGFDGISDAYIY